ncbi:hypothetical protein Cma02nite_15000 [Cellulomonas marina]|nr:hypothetical protein Cma02nite_15000 [Cellulomonas marina]
MQVSVEARAFDCDRVAKYTAVQSDGMCHAAIRQIEAALNDCSNQREPERRRLCPRFGQHALQEIGAEYPASLRETSDIDGFAASQSMLQDVTCQSCTNCHSASLPTGGSAGRSPSAAFRDPVSSLSGRDRGSLIGGTRRMQHARSP